jgi:hypothetical protein
MTLRLGSPDRRQPHRRSPGGEPSRSELVATIVGAYRDFPGLCLSLPQAARLFGLPVPTCEAVLRDLVGLCQLNRDNDGLYRRYDANRVTIRRRATWR